MVKVTINRDHNGNIISFKLTGHANFDVRGQDIVCAGVSAVSFGSVNAIEQLTGVVPEIKQGKDGGYFECHYPSDLSDETAEKVQLLLEAMVLSLKTIELSYSQYVKILSM